MNKKKILVLGATGAMGTYLVPELMKCGYRVDAVSYDAVESDNPDLKYIQADAKNNEFIAELLKNNYDAIFDFLNFYDLNDEELKDKLYQMLDATEQYFYLSSYRVYDGKDVPITEEARLLLNSSTDEKFLATHDYALYKAVGENILKESGRKNWTAVRPAITFSKMRYQLVTLEAPVLIERMKAGKTVLLPKEAMNKQATMSWAGDVAKLFVKLLFNEKAYGEIYTISTSEHHTWGEIAEMYAEIGGLKYKAIDKEDYIQIFGGTDVARYQLEYDRLFDRVIDNSKILEATGMKQSEFMTLKDALKMELSQLPEDAFTVQGDISQNMDKYLKEKGE